MAHVRLDRGIVDHWVYKDAEYFKVWFEMLYRARYCKDSYTDMHEGELITVNYAEFIFGRVSWSDRLKISEQRLRTLLKKLQDDNMIQLVRQYRKCSVYLILNYEKYNQQSNQQNDLLPEAINAQANQQDNRQPTSNQPAANQQPTTKDTSNTSKESNKDIKYSVEFESFWDSYPRQIGKPAAFKNYKKLRKQHSAEYLMGCAMNYQSYCIANGTETQYIKMPNNFLNAKDEYFKQFETPVLIHNKGQSKGGKKLSSFDRLQQLAKEEQERGAVGHH